MFVFRQAIAFPDQLAEVQVRLRVRNCPIPAAGSYLVTLSVDGQWVAGRRFRVTQAE